MPPKSTIERQYQYLIRTIAEHGNSDACLLWPFHICKRWGYAYVSVPYEGVKRIHRVAYKLAHGHYPIHDGCHHCDTRSCYNPKHIFDGTDKENFADMVAKGRSPKGSRNHQAKTTEDVVLKIREEFSQGTGRLILAEKYGMPLSTLKKIIYRLHWKHI